MADPSILDPMFPRLDAAQIARLTPFGRRRRAVAGEILSEQGSVKHEFYVLLSGQIEIVSPSAAGEARITIHEAGEFTGELDIVSGRFSLVRARALVASELLEIDVAKIRRIVPTDPQ